MPFRLPYHVSAFTTMPSSSETTAMTGAHSVLNALGNCSQNLSPEPLLSGQMFRPPTRHKLFMPGHKKSMTSSKAVPSYTASVLFD